MGARAREGLAVCLAAAAILVAVHSLSGPGEVVFKAARQQSRQFIEWYRTIKLTPQQEAVKKAALESLPADCCRDNSVYTCCCECNISRTIWGLSNYLIAKQGATTEKVREKVQEWVRFINPNGYSGQACYKGGCGRPFAQDGCGGMHSDKLVF